MKCGRIGCNNRGKYQPVILIRASIIPASGKDILAQIKMPFTVCSTHRFSTTTAEILGAVPTSKMQKIMEESRQRTGAAPNPDRMEVVWVRILGR
jgi:hypothetical protein